MRRSCIGFGQVIDTDRPIIGTLPVAAHPAGEGATATIRVRHAPAVRPMRAGSPMWSLRRDVLSFAPPGVAVYRCTDRAISVHPVPGASDGMVDALLVATALPAVLWRQGAFVIHAAAVVAQGDGAALAIAGRSGIGKSTLAAAFLARGARLVADDSIALRTGAAPTCAGLAGGYHLGGAGDDRDFHPVADAVGCRSTPLRAVVVLDDDAVAAGVRLTGVDAVQALLANRHRANAARYCGRDAHGLRDAASLARGIAVYRWPRHQADALLRDDIRQAIMERGAR